METDSISKDIPMFITLGITQEMYDTIVTEEQARQGSLESQLKQLDTPPDDFDVSVSYLLDLLDRLPELYTRSKHSEKLEWHRMMFSNASLKQERLHWNLKSPFDAVLHANETKVWLPLAEVFRTQWRETISMVNQLSHNGLISTVASPDLVMVANISKYD